MAKVTIHFNTSLWTEHDNSDPESLLNQITSKENDWLTINSKNCSTTYNKRLITMVIVQKEGADNE